MPRDSPAGSPCQVPPPERRPPYRGPSKFVNRAPYPCFRRGCPLFRPIRPDSEAPKRSHFRASQAITRVVPSTFPGNHRCDVRFYAATVSHVPSREVRAFGATSPPALQTETPSCALGLRTATEAVGVCPSAVGDLLSSVLTPSWRRRRGLGPRRTILTWCVVKGSTAVEGVSTSYPSNDKGFTARRWCWPGLSAVRRLRSRNGSRQGGRRAGAKASATRRGRTSPVGAGRGPRQQRAPGPRQQREAGPVGAGAPDPGGVASTELL